MLKEPSLAGVPWRLSDMRPAEEGAPTAFSCFSCGGGSTMGYKLAGFRMEGCLELDEDMMRVYQANHHPRLAYREAIQSFRLRDDLPPELHRLDVLDGSPPCSTFSMSGDREKAWGRKRHFREGQAEQVLDDLFLHFVALAERLRPAVAVSENVKGMIAGNAKGYVREIFKKFRAAGYDTQLFLLNSSRMGVPQRRERVFFVSRRSDLSLPPLSLSFDERPIGVSDAIAGAGGERKPLSASFLPWWSKARMGRSLSDGHPRGSFFNSFKLHPELPSPTITATGASNFCHWQEPVCLSGREVARLQSFPDDFDFAGISEQYVCGMSVPPLMMQRLALEVRRQTLKK